MIERRLIDWVKLIAAIAVGILAFFFTIYSTPACATDPELERIWSSYSSRIGVPDGDSQTEIQIPFSSNPQTIYDRTGRVVFRTEKGIVYDRNYKPILRYEKGRIYDPVTWKLKGYYNEKR